MSGKGGSSSSSSSSSNTSSTDKPEKKDESKKGGDEEDDSDPSLKSAYNTSVSAPPLQLVVVHPLVLLSVVDHYTRVAKDTSKRVVGVLLGEVSGAGKVDVTNSYAVPFEEDVKDSAAWYIDRQYHEDMYGMFKKVNASEKIVGWYSTGPKLRATDLAIHELFRAYCRHPVLVIVDVDPLHNPLEIPTLAYVSVESSPEQQRASRRQFAHLPSEIGAYEAEEVGVEHLLRNIRDTTESSLGEQVNAKLASLKGLANRLGDIHDYLGAVERGDMPVRHEIIARVQDMMNLLPAVDDPRLKQAMSAVVNDNAMTIYVGSLVRAILATHDLIVNKLNNQRAERAERDKEAAAAADAKAGKDGSEGGEKEGEGKDKVKGKEDEKAGKEKDEQKQKQEEEKKQ